MKILYPPPPPKKKEHRLPNYLLTSLQYFPTPLHSGPPNVSHMGSLRVYTRALSVFTHLDPIWVKPVCITVVPYGKQMKNKMITFQMYIYALLLFFKHNRIQKKKNILRSKLFVTTNICLCVVIGHFYQYKGPSECFQILLNEGTSMSVKSICAATHFANHSKPLPMWYVSPVVLVALKPGSLQLLWYGGNRNQSEG